MTDWIFVCTEKWLGSWRPNGGISPNTLESYTISPYGTWVPAVDWEWLSGFRKACATCGSDRTPVQIVNRVNPTEAQLRSKPEHMPRVREISTSVFGLESLDEAEPPEEDSPDEELGLLERWRAEELTDEFSLDDEEESEGE